MTTTATRIYSLRQAADLTGFSQGKFRYNRELLVSHGVQIDADGWRIPHAVLEELGWLGVKPPRAEVAAPSRAEMAEARVAELEAEVARLTEQLGSRRGLFGRKR